MTPLAVCVVVAVPSLLAGAVSGYLESAWLVRYYRGQLRQAREDIERLGWLANERLKSIHLLGTVVARLERER